MKTILIATLLSTTLLARAQTPPPSVTTTGTAHVYAVPDEVVVDVFIRNEDNDLQKASSMTDLQVKNVLAVCKAYKIAPEHAQSTRRNYGRNYRYKEGQPKYEASQTINICLKDLSKYDAFMQEMIALDVNNIGGTLFRTTKHREHMDEARKKAIIAAKEKAELFAGQLGQNVGNALQITESNAGQHWSGASAYANVESTSDQSSSGSDGSSFSPGQLKIEAEVIVSFALQ